MNEHQFHNLVLRVTNSDDYEELRRRQELVAQLIREVEAQSAVDSEDLRGFLSSSSLFTEEDLHDGVAQLSDLKRLREQLHFLHTRLTIARKQLTGEQVCKLIEQKGYQVEHRWEDDGLHVAISNPTASFAPSLFSITMFSRTGRRDNCCHALKLTTGRWWSELLKDRRC